MGGAHKVAGPRVGRADATAEAAEGISSWSGSKPQVLSHVLDTMKADLGYSASAAAAAQQPISCNVYSPGGGEREQHNRITKSNPGEGSGFRGAACQGHPYANGIFY